MFMFFVWIWFLMKLSFPSVKKKENVIACKIASLEHLIFMFDHGTQKIPFTMKIYTQTKHMSTI